MMKTDQQPEKSLSEQTEDTVSHFYELAWQYHMAAFFLFDNIVDGGYAYLFNPCLFLLRHTGELLLKGLIVKRAGLNGNTLSKYTLNISGRSLRFTGTHSLAVLWQHLLQLPAATAPDAPFTPQEIAKLSQMFEQYSRRDEKSTTYRYPYSKEGEELTLEPFDYDFSGLTDELTAEPPLIIQTSQGLGVVTGESAELDELRDLFDALEHIFQRLEPPDTDQSKTPTTT